MDSLIGESIYSYLSRLQNYIPAFPSSRLNYIKDMNLISHLYFSCLFVCFSGHPVLPQATKSVHISVIRVPVFKMHFSALRSQKLYSEGSTTTTGIAGIGVFESEAPVVQAILPVHLHPEEVELMRFIHDAGYPGDLEMVVVDPRLVETQYIGHTGTTAPFHSYPEFLGMIKTIGGHQATNFGYCSFSERNGSCLHGFHTTKLIKVLIGKRPPVFEERKLTDHYQLAGCRTLAGKMPQSAYFCIKSKSSLWT